MPSNIDKLSIDLVLADMKDALSAAAPTAEGHDRNADPLYLRMKRIYDRTGTILIRNRGGGHDSFTCFIVENPCIFLIYGLPANEWFELPSEELSVEWDFDVSGPPYQERKPAKYTFKPIPAEGRDTARHVILGMESSQQANDFFSQLRDLAQDQSGITLVRIGEPDTDAIFTDGFGG